MKCKQHLFCLKIDIRERPDFEDNNFYNQLENQNVIKI